MDNLSQRCKYLQIEVNKKTYIYNYSKMILTLWLLFLSAYAAQSHIYPFLHINPNTYHTLNEDDQFISPLGQFKMTILSNCSMAVQQFNPTTQAYEDQSELVNIFTHEDPTEQVQNCEIIINGTDQISIGNLSDYFNQSILQGTLLLDDFGRLTLLLFAEDQLANPSLQQTHHLHQFNSINPNLFMHVGSINFTNKGNWTFVSDGEVLKITNEQGDATEFHLHGLNTDYEGVKDADGELLRFSEIPGITYHPPAANTTECGSQFMGPFVFEVDDTFPIIRLYNRKKYQSLQFALSPSASPTYFCPSKTFQLNGECVTSCPQPYYHEIREDKGRCVLNCEYGSEIEQVTRVCTSNNYQPHTLFNTNQILHVLCSLDSVYYPYGCYCEDGFYDSDIQACVHVCSMKQIGVNGTCVPCPENCMGCELDPTLTSYLKCQENKCMRGYEYKDGQCVGVKTCDVEHCEQCAESKCISCQPLYLIHDGQCLLECPSNTLTAISSDGRGGCFQFDNLVEIQSDDPSPQTIQIHQGQNIQQINAEDFIPVFYNGKPHVIRKRCEAGQRVHNQFCREQAQQCPTEFQPVDDRCVCEEGTVQLGNIHCTNASTPSGMYYEPTYRAYLNCPIGCFSCEGQNCLSCAPGYILIVSTLGSVCRKNNPQITCQSEFYVYDSEKMTCVVNSSFIDEQENKCPSNSCSLCVEGQCLYCQTGYLRENECVEECAQGEKLYKGVCRKQTLLNCAQTYIHKVVLPIEVSDEVIDGSVFQHYTKDGVEVSVDPIASIFFMRRQLGLPTNSSTTMPSKLYTGQERCLRCENNFQLIDGSCVACGENQTLRFNKCSNCRFFEQQTDDNKCRLICPQREIFNEDLNKCQPCEDNQIQVDNLCHTCEPYEQVRNNRCVHRCKQKQIFSKEKCIPCQAREQQRNNRCVIPCQDNCTCLRNEIKVNGTCEKCPGNFIRSDNNKCMCPFKDGKDCRNSCPSGKVPTESNQDNTIIECKEPQDSRHREQMQIDSSVYPLGDDYNMFYFVIDSVLHKDFNNDTQFILRYDSSVKNSLGQSVAGTGSKEVQFNNRSYIGVALPAEYDEAYIDFGENLGKLKSANGNYLGSGVYGARKGSTHIDNSRHWLAIIGYIISFVIIIIHAVYIGNGLLYKVDNLIIFVQSIYFFSFIKLLVGIPLAQFYYGYLYSHFGFYPNYFTRTLPDGYVEGFAEPHEVPLPYRLLSVDANFIRNVGFAFSLLLTFIVAWLLIVLVVYVLKGTGRSEVWYPKIAKDSLLAAVQFLTMAIMYWSVAHLLHNEDPFSTEYFSTMDEKYVDQYQRPGVEDHDSFRRSCSIAATIMIILICLYSIIRMCFNKIGGLYMFKRMLFAIILAGSAYQPFYIESQDFGYVYSSTEALLAALVVVQLLFMIIRLCVETQRDTCSTILIVFEGVLMGIGYIIMYLWDDTGFTSIVVSLFILIFIVMLVQDLVDVYNDAQDEFYDEDVGLVPGLMQKIPTTERNA